jgi:hypothetical protein
MIDADYACKSYSYSKIDKLLDNLIVDLIA